MSTSSSNFRSARALGTALLLAAIGFSGSALAAVITVDSTGDTDDPVATDGICGVPDVSNPGSGVAGTCTLRAALTEANGNASSSNTINISVTGTTTAGSDYPALKKPVTIVGPANRFTVNASNHALLRTSVSPQATGGTYAFSKLILTNGTTASALGGGAIYINALGATTVTLSDVDVTSSDASAGPGGGIAVEFDASSSSLSLARVSLSGNTATGDGGALWVLALGSATMSMDDSTVSGNTSNANGGGVAIEDGRLGISNSTFSGNAAASGGGIYLGFNSSGGSTRLENSTLSGNSATASGGGIGTASNNPAASWVSFNTIFNNTAASGGGIKGATSPNTTFPGNTGANPFTSNVIAGNTGGNCGAAFSPAHNDTLNSGYNLSDDSTCGFVDGTNHDRVVGNSALKIAALASNPTTPQTHALLAGSPAIDAGNPNPLIDTGADERGADSQDGGADGTPGDSPAVRDIGAYEFGGYGVVALAANNFTIAEDSGPVVVLVKRYGVGSGATSSPTVNLGTNTPGGPGFATAGTSCTASVDYVTINPNPTGLTFSGTAGLTQFNQSANVTICNDSTPESTETFNLTLAKTGTVGYDLGPISSGTVTITDAENGTFQFSASTASSPEGNPGSNGSVTLTVTRTGTHGAVDVPYATSSTCTTACTATAGTDYTASSGTLHFNDGDSSKTITINFIGDFTYEPGGETFEVTLSAPSCTGLTGGQTCDAILGATKTSRVTITDDDTAEPGTISFVVPAGGYVAMENGGSMTVTLTRTPGPHGGLDGSVTVAYSIIDGTYTTSGPTGDYYLDLVNPHTVTWGAGVGGNQTFSVTMVDDNTVESNRTFTLQLDPPTGGTGGQSPQPQTTQTTDVTLISDEQPSFQFAAATYSVSEGGAQAVTVTADAFTGPPVTVAYTQSGTATNPADYTLAAQSGDTVGSMTFDGSGTSHTITVNAVSDGVIEGNENFALTLGTPVGGGTLGATNPTTVTIVDPAAVRFLPSTVFSSTNEAAGSTITVSVERIGSTTGAVDVTATISQDCASQPTAGCAQPTVDYTKAGGFSAPLHWNSGEGGVKTFAITVLGDTLIEGDETIALSLGTPTGALLGSPSTAKALIRDDDYSLQIGNVTVDEAVGTAHIQVQRTGTGSAIGAASVDYATSDGTAKTSTSDYTAASGTLNWAAGSTTPQVIDVPVNNDSAIEGDETFTITLSNASTNASGEATTVNGSPATVTIHDNDASVAFSAASQSVSEGVGFVTVTATRTGASDFAISVPFTVSGTATGIVDDNATDGTITIAANAASGSYTFMVIDDSKDEADETVVFTMGTPSGGTGTVATASPTVHTVTITDNDATTVAFSAASQTVGEAAGTVTVTATRTGTTDFSIDVPFTVAKSGSVANTAANGTITIPANQSSASYTFNVTDDTVDGADETVTFTMGTPTGGSVSAAAPTTHTVTITDNDAVTVAFSAASQSVGEAAGTVTVTAVRTGSTNFSIDVPFTVAQSGSIATDAANGTITIPANQSSASYTFNVVDDAVNGADDTVTFTMGTPTGGTVSAVAPTTHTVTIVDNDATTVAFSAASQTVGENAGTVTVTAVRTGATTFSIDVPFTVSQSGSITTDAANGTITIPANQTSASYTFNVTDDAVDGADETVTFTMGTPTGGNVSAAAPTTHTVTITDNDTTTVAFSTASQTVGEGAGTVTVTAVRTGGTTSPIDVPFTVTKSGSIANTAANGTITIPANVSSGTYTFNVTDDAVDGANDTVTFTMGTPTGGDVTAGAPSTHTVTITDNDSPPPASGGGGGGGSFSLLSLWMLVPVWLRRRRAH